MCGHKGEGARGSTEELVTHVAKFIVLWHFHSCQIFDNLELP